MKNTSIRIKIGDRELSVSTVEIKILLLRAGLTITDVATRIGYSREATSKTISGSLQFPELRKKLTVELERIAADLAASGARQRRAS